MTIRYVQFADGNVLTAEQLLAVQNNGVVQVDTFAELIGLDSNVNAAYVETDKAFYIKKADNSWGSVGGLAVVQAAAPSSPQVGQIWFDTDAILPNPAKYSYEGTETITNTGSFAALANLTNQTVTLTEPAWVHVSYGVVEPVGDNTAGINYGVQLSGATTRAVGVADAATSYVAGKNSVSNDFYAIFNAGSTVVTPVARKTGSGTVSVVNPYMTIAPIRWS
ncbi:hypothetical protein UFOVP660_13 [uncultured Caudovirales phage]|uniref:Uncharacterized protein n=1 Tax=uncultured Caudovirales phage TaxID=2100421 RepID=A0A6J5NAF4_9CAUD|nr:hypothetical protein UFOVP660_13 [uncultured Caudovirales phage]